MKGTTIILAVLGGAIAGATLGLLFAPNKGEDTRRKIKECLSKKGLCGCNTAVDEMIDEVALSAKEAVV